MRVRAFIMVAALTLTLGVAIPLLTGCGKGADQHSAAKKTQYHCPMHPTVVSDKPGDCPICGMRLVPMDDGQKHESSPAASAAPAAAATVPKKTMYRSTMNPNEVSDKPAKDSMGMEMAPFEVTGGGEPTPSGLSVVSIMPAARERMGLTLGVVEKRALSREVRTSAKIVADETKLYKVTTKIEGYVGELFVSVTGQEVKKGDPLLTIYGPDLMAAEQEYLIALQSKQKLTASNPDAAQGGQSLLEAARRRLELWDISDEQIERLEKTGKVEKFLTLDAPASGWVTEKDVLAGQKIMAGEPLLVIADLSTVWADADIYQSDLPYVKVGMRVELSLPYWPGKKFTGKVTFVSPTLDVESRTLKARLEIPNPEVLLKPGMFAAAQLSYELGEGLAIPEAAVMRTAEQTYAFRDAGDGRLVPTPIIVGERSDGYYQLVSGLSEGDKVVTSANFLVDSESSMKAALESMTGGTRQP